MGRIESNVFSRLDYTSRLLPESKKSVTADTPQIHKQEPLNFSSTQGLNLGYALKFGIDNFKLRFAVPLPSGGSNKSYDGALVGANNQAYSPSTSLSALPTVEPRNGRTSDETIIYVNGINTTFDSHTHNLQAIADKTGQPVIGIYNSTEGMLKDLIQSAGDKYDIGNNPAVTTMANTVYNELKAGRSVHLMAHSQGGLITSRALQDVQNRLRLEGGMSRAQVEALMHDKVKVETFGSAASSYPNGPQYVHYVNNKDLVPGLFGLGKGVQIPWGLRLAAYANPVTRPIMAFIDAVSFLAKPSINPGNGAQVHYFTKNPSESGLGKYFEGTHTFEPVYLSRRVPFDQAVKGKF